MSQNYLALWYHLVWSTKNREPWIGSWKWQLFKQLKSYCTVKGYHLDHINAMPDHVHLLVSPKPTIPISEVVMNIKRHSYYWLQEEGIAENPIGWQDGYAALTVSPSHLQRVRNYIRNQEIHHKDLDFSQELEQLRMATSIQ